MEKIINTDNTACSDSDISGVKALAAETAPEQSKSKLRHVADDGKKNGEISVNDIYADTGAEARTKTSEPDTAFGKGESTASSAEEKNCVPSACELSDAKREDREFLSLIKGKYRDAYRRRTEEIIRKRLKSTKGKQPSKDEKALTEIPSAECVSVVLSEVPNLTAAAEIAVNVSDEAKKDDLLLLSEKKKQLLSVQKNKNLIRPRENGVGGSVGMYTGIKVSALKGSDVLALLRRAEAGEKIKFN